MHSPNCFLDNNAYRKFHTIIFKSTTIQLNFRSVKYDNDDEIFIFVLTKLFLVDFSLRLKNFVKLIPGRTHTNNNNNKMEFNRIFAIQFNVKIDMVFGLLDQQRRCIFLFVYKKTDTIYVPS